MQLSLRDSIEIHVGYDDRSPFGTTVSGQLEARLKQRLSPAIDLLQSNALEAVGRTPAMFEKLGLGRSGEFFDAANHVRDELSFPDPADTVPATLGIFRGSGRPTRISIPPELVRDLACWLGDWQRGAAQPSTPGPAGELWGALNELDCFTERRESDSVRAPVTFVGHATVRLTGPATTLLIDPFLQARDEVFPLGYQPITHGDFTSDAVLVTHSHPDHFNVDSLLRIGRDTPIFVPEVGRESALAADMVYRLSELGFRAVRSLGWNQEATIGDFRVIALPMFGEQPVADAELPPGIRNAGNNYLVEGRGADTRSSRTRGATTSATSDNWPHRRSNATARSMCFSVATGRGPCIPSST